MTIAPSTAETRITANLVRVQQRIATACARAARAPAEVTLIAVTKGRPLADVAALWRAGITDAGENRVQEGEAKRRAAEAAGVQGLRWHLIGHLQRNKAARALAAFDVFHGIDNAAVLEAVARRAVRPVEVFLEGNVAPGPAKHGCAPGEPPGRVATGPALPGIPPGGLLDVGPARGGPRGGRHGFRQLRLLAQAYGLPKLSMGMSNDFEVAIEEGATHVRIGRALFEGAPR